MLVFQKRLKINMLISVANLAAFFGQKVTFSSPNELDKRNLHKSIKFVHTEGARSCVGFIGGEE